MKLNQTWLPAGSGTEPLKIAFPSLPPEIYELLAQGLIAVRWNGKFLPVQMANPSSWYHYPAAAGLEFTVPPQLRVPGFTEMVLWNTATQQPLPYREWIPVLIPVQAAVFEADTASDSLAAAATGDGTATGTGGQITIYRLSTGELIHTLQIPATHRILAFTPDTLYAWLIRNDQQGLLERWQISTGQVDQQIQLTNLSGSGPIYAEVYRPDPRILIVFFPPLVFQPSGVAQAYLDAKTLPNTEYLVRPLAFDDRGRLLTVNGKACELSTTTGISNCVAVVPGASYSFSAVWKNKGVRGGVVVDLTTGKTLLSITYANEGRGLYLAESNRLLLSSGGANKIADGDSLEVWADGLFRGDEALVFQRVWAPDWLLARWSQGILVGHIPQLAPAPIFPAAGVVNAASGQAGPLAPGEIISIYGQNLGPAEGAGPVLDTKVKLATEVERTEVLFDGVPGAVLYAGPKQINVVVPETVQYSSSARLQVTHYGIPSARIELPTGAYSPALFGYWFEGKMYAAALTADGRVQGPNEPLQAGRVAVLYATGLGLLAGQTADGIPARAAELPIRPSIAIGGRTAQVLYAGAAPGLTAGLTQINVIVPADAPAGRAVEVVIGAGSQSQGNVWVTVQ